MSRPPSFIPLPPPPSWPDTTNPESPAPRFFTPPSSPTPTPSPSLFFTPPSSPFDPLPFPTPAPPPPAPDSNPHPDDPFPPSTDAPIDLGLDDDGLSTLEKIYLYSRSKASFHRIFIAHRLPEYLPNVSPQEAVEYVLPLLSMLAMDQEDSVKEALAEELIPVIWWFFTHCQIIPDELTNDEKYASSSATVTISVQAFTPILGTLLLSEVRTVGPVARESIVQLLNRMRRLDEHEHGTRRLMRSMSSRDFTDDDDEPLPYIGLFGPEERALFTREILHQIVIGMGRLDIDVEADEAAYIIHQDATTSSSKSTQGDWSNPYFPPISYAPGPPPADTAQSTATPSLYVTNGIHRASVGQDSPPPLLHQPAQSPDTDLGSPMAVDIQTEYDDQGALGRVAAMGLIAAVVSGGPLDATTLKSFVDEAERIARDPSFSVRKSVCLALGALAKEVPDDLVPRLLPLFDSLRWDAVFEVRHSSLYALPAILSRLSFAQRRTVALETMGALSTDQHPEVRLGILELLGEVIHTFIDDPSGPPQEILQLFLGRREDRCVRDDQQMVPAPSNPSTALDFFYTQPNRAIVCAFNFPAVALVLGQSRWHELREVYLDLAQNPDPDVQRTLAASVGELSKIIGVNNARRDLVNIWRNSIHSNENSVREKAIASLADFIKVIGIEIGLTFIDDLYTTWKNGMFRNWRERESIQRRLVSWFVLFGIDCHLPFQDLFMLGLEDSAAAVREAAISILPEIWAVCSSRPNVLTLFQTRIWQLSASSISRQRMTFIACCHALADADGQYILALDSPLIDEVLKMSDDAIEGVRIGVARFAALIFQNLLQRGHFVQPSLRQLIDRLSGDSSQEVRSYVHMLQTEIPEHLVKTPSSPKGRRARQRMVQAALFSRPPYSFSGRSSITCEPLTSIPQSSVGSNAGGPDKASIIDGIGSVHTHHVSLTSSDWTDSATMTDPEPNPKMFEKTAFMATGHSRASTTYNPHDLSTSNGKDRVEVQAAG